MLDESFLLYGEELDMATRLHDAGWNVLFTPEVEIIHAIGVSTGRSRRMTLMHSASIYRYYRKHRAADGGGSPFRSRGWRSACGPSSPGSREGSPDEGRRAGGRRGHAPAPAHETMPKPLLPLMDRPSSITCSITSLATACTRSCFLARTSRRRSDPFIESRRGDPADHLDHRDRAARHRRRDRQRARGAGTDEPFFALNGDILTDLDLTSMLEFHREHGAAATIALTHVEDARAFGLVLDRGPRSRARVPREARPSRSPATSTPGRMSWTPRCSQLVARGEASRSNGRSSQRSSPTGDRVSGFLSDAYWLDLGTPAAVPPGALRPVRGQGARRVVPVALGLRDRGRRPSSAPRPVGGCGCRGVVVEARGADRRLRDSSRAVVGTRARVVASIVGPGARVGAGATLMGCVLGERSSVSDGFALEGARVSAGTAAVPE